MSMSINLMTNIARPGAKGVKTLDKMAQNRERALEEIFGQTTRYHNGIKSSENKVVLSSAEMNNRGLKFFKNSIGSFLDFFCQGK